MDELDCLIDMQDGYGPNPRIAKADRKVKLFDMQQSALGKRIIIRLAERCSPGRMPRIGTSLIDFILDSEYGRL